MCLICIVDDQPKCDVNGLESVKQDEKKLELKTMTNFV